MKNENQPESKTTEVRYSDLNVDFLRSVAIDLPCMHGISMQKFCAQCKQLSIKWKDFMK